MNGWMDEFNKGHIMKKKKEEGERGRMPLSTYDTATTFFYFYFYFLFFIFLFF